MSMFLITSVVKKFKENYFGNKTKLNKKNNRGCNGVSYHSRDKTWVLVAIWRENGVSKSKYCQLTFVSKKIMIMNIKNKRLRY